MSSASFACQSDAFSSASKRDSSMCSGISSDESASELPHVSANCSDVCAAEVAAADEKEEEEEEEDEDDGNNDDDDDDDDDDDGVAKIAPAS